MATTRGRRRTSLPEQLGQTSAISVLPVVHDALTGSLRSHLQVAVDHLTGVISPVEPGGSP